MSEAEGWTPLMAACVSDEDAVHRLRELIDAGADVNSSRLLMLELQKSVDKFDDVIARLRRDD